MCIILQGSTITIKSPYVITYIRQNFGVCDVRGQIPKIIIRRFTFYAVIFLTKFNKIADSAKTNIEVSSKKNPRLNPKNIFQKSTVWRGWVTLNIIVSYNFPKNFFEIHLVPQKI